jgi:uroporphyrin-III C-methyltransferase / precorrin-2 dehydrogenase / sirohydrochlorin ferrochelatase
VLAGRRPRRSAAVRTALVEALQTGLVSDTGEHVRPGVALVGGGPGDPELITVRGRRLLARADVVVTDRLGPRELLDTLGPHVEVIDASKIPYGRAMNQAKINELLVEHARAGKFVVRLKGGDPYVFGRGFEEVLACADAGVPVTVVPGVTSAFAAPAVADVPVSHRGVAHEIVVVSGHLPPDDPRSLVDWPALARLRGTVVLLMAVERIGAFAAALVDGGRPADTPVAVVQDGTMRIQRSVRATLATVAEAVRREGISPPAVVVVGPVAGLVDGPVTT